MSFTDQQPRVAKVMRNPHCILIPLRDGAENLVGPTLAADEHWKCGKCGKVGLWAEMDEPEALATGAIFKVCLYPYPACQWCGQTPLCAPDCVGIRMLLSDSRIYIAGETP